MRFKNLKFNYGSLKLLESKISVLIVLLLNDINSKWFKTKNLMLNMTKAQNFQHQKLKAQLNVTSSQVKNALHSIKKNFLMKAVNVQN